MRNKQKSFKTLEDSINLNHRADVDFTVLISDLYIERLLKRERETKVMLDKLVSAIQGKELILESNSKIIHK